MCKSAIVVTVVLLFTHTNAESGEDVQAFTYYAPSTLNFHDIYANSLALLTGETSSPVSVLKDDDTFHLNNLPSHFVEFHQIVSSSTTVASKHAQKSDLERNSTKTVRKSTLSTLTTEEPDELTVKVIPISKRKSMYQRGVLDLLFPATRVKNFKSVFDTVRRLLSHTF